MSNFLTFCYFFVFRFNCYLGYLFVKKSYFCHYYWQLANITFAKLAKLAILLHIGGYLGKNVIINGAIYNVVEATGSFGRKIAFSWVDNDGTLSE